MKWLNIQEVTEDGFYWTYWPSDGGWTIVEIWTHKGKAKEIVFSGTEITESANRYPLEVLYYGPLTSPTVPSSTDISE